nr:hypothetical protein [Tanacetum cinerariifolium]
MQDDEAEPAKLTKLIEVVTTAKLMTEVVTATAATTTATTITVAQMPMASAARKRKGVVIIDPEETATPSVIVHSEPKSKDKGKGILVEEPKPLKKQAQIERDEAYARELEAELNANINWNKVIEQATPLALKVPVVDYQIHTEHNKPYYKIIRADGTHQLFLSFISLLRNFDKEELEMLWKIVQERFASSEPKITAAAATTVATTIIVAPMPTASAARIRKSIVIRDPEETATSSVIVHSEPKSKDKGKRILVKEPKPLKKQAHIEQDEAYARELEAELNTNINWNEVIEQVKRKEKQDNAVLRYQALKRKTQTKAQARKTMMVYLKNMARFKIDFFKGTSYDEIRPIFEKHFNSIVAFLEKAKKQKLDEEVEELKTHLQIIPNDEDDVEDLEMLWKIVQERFASSEPKNFSDDFLLNTLKTIFKKPNVEAHIWKNQRGSYGLAKVKSWKLLESCGIHIITFTTT